MPSSSPGGCRAPVQAARWVAHLLNPQCSEEVLPVAQSLEGKVRIYMQVKAMSSLCSLL